MLATATQPKSLSEIAASTGIPRATATAVVNELESAGWLTRDGELRYRVGPAMPRAVEATMPREVQDVLGRIAGAAQAGATISRISPKTLTIVAKAQAGHRAVTGFAVGQTIPLAFPAGSAVMPWRSSEERAQWLDTARGLSARSGQRLLRQVSDCGYVIYRPDHDDTGMVDLLSDLLGSVGSEVMEAALRERLLRQLSRLTSRLYSRDELVSDDVLPISYLAAPIFVGADASYELQLGPLLPSATRAEREVLITTLTRGARELSGLMTL
ncbi:IclR family transcriptional regulator [Mycobacteroides chelonae]|uniref:IclR family transcriptional regulator n=2 Tax=Mycobacteriaceae TaxID=1762 RepID=A0A1S1LQI8_MYCCH|nr:IclR family transcriptional regulator [Mycobacteroides sp. H003]KRQ32849.1 IclR family transcriptional regulator [Mycobacteroides sp. H092]KRQ43318.1 IclR family transcriptional regulator [Mycobacteroides sp. H063]KRQ44723.1 IclR family transcriptional regulator [Mycobacteroides sp. H101]KRQ57948.1 IclR family transcriptional regulator [Mycobacteroides sp. HXVII]KRQ64944.1 IclR family transcriptional regulator [Mycobacteroides sp. H079]KRQ73563.1 IclR family transcriptional regulator [Myco